ARPLRQAPGHCARPCQLPPPHRPRHRRAGGASGQAPPGDLRDERQVRQLSRRAGEPHRRRERAGQGSGSHGAI
ncbi:MAG: hypothetical protein AVDCRST_MAG23-65, partial [uncultured Sphingosinicella sp.]